MNIRALTVFCAAAIGTATVQAQVPRTFVSVFGSDANPCSRTEPCRNFAAAIAAVASQGEVVPLDSGGYGAVAITKSVSILTPDNVYAAIAPTSGDAISVNAATTDSIRVRGLVLNGRGAIRGISIAVAGSVHIEDCTIQGFFGVGGGGIYNAQGETFISDSVVRGNTTGIYIGNDILGMARAMVRNCRLEQNNYDGLSVLGVARVTAIDTIATGNRDGGFGAANYSAELNLERCVASNNVRGVWSVGDFSNVIVRLSGCTVTGNTGNGLDIIGSAQLLSRTNNTVEGNGTNGNFTGTFPAQ